MIEDGQVYAIPAYAYGMVLDNSLGRYEIESNEYGKV